MLVPSWTLEHAGGRETVESAQEGLYSNCLKHDYDVNPSVSALELQLKRS